MDQKPPDSITHRLLLANTLKCIAGAAEHPDDWSRKPAKQWRAEDAVTLLDEIYKWMAAGRDYVLMLPADEGVISAHVLLLAVEDAFGAVFTYPWREHMLADRREALSYMRRITDSITESCVVGLRRTALSLTAEAERQLKGHVIPPVLPDVPLLPKPVRNDDNPNSAIPRDVEQKLASSPMLMRLLKFCWSRRSVELVELNPGVWAEPPSIPAVKMAINRVNTALVEAGVPKTLSLTGRTVRWS